MNARLSSAASLVLHIVLLAMLSVIALRPQKLVPTPPVGMEIEITTPEEVAEYVYRGLSNDDYWILPQTEKSKAALRARVEGMINNVAPAVPDVL